MYINFQSNRVSRSVKTVHTHLLAIQRKLHKYATCNSNFKKIPIFGHTLLYNRDSGQFWDLSGY